MFIHLEWYEMHQCHMLFIEYLVQVVRKIKDWPQNLISVQVGMLCFMLNKNQKFLWLNVHLSKCWTFWVFFQTFPKFSLSPVPDFVLNQKRSGEERNIAVYQIGNHLSPSSLNLKAVYEEKLTFSNSSLPPVYANRFVTGINKLKFKSTSKIEYLKGGSLYCKYMDRFLLHIQIEHNT